MLISEYPPPPQAWQEEAVQPSLDVSVLPRVDTGHVAGASSQYWHNNISLLEIRIFILAPCDKMNDNALYQRYWQLAPSLPTDDITAAMIVSFNLQFCFLLQVAVF